VFWEDASVWGKISKSDGRRGNVVSDPQWANRGFGSLLLFLRLCAVRRRHADGEAALWIQACGCRGVSKYRWFSWSCQWAHYCMHCGAGTLLASLGQPTPHFELYVVVGTALWRKLYCFFCSQVPNDAHNLQSKQDVSTRTLSLHSAMFTGTTESPLGAQVKNSTPRCVSGNSTELHAAQFALKRRFVLSTQIGRHRFWATLGTRHLKWAAQAEGTVLRRGKEKNV
jgi:hypothetical protein